MYILQMNINQPLPDSPTDMPSAGLHACQILGTSELWIRQNFLYFRVLGTSELWVRQNFRYVRIVGTPEF